MSRTIARLVKIASRIGKRLGVKSAVYANAQAFDVLCERDGFVFWHRFSTSDAYTKPAQLARAMRQDMNRVWA